MSNSTDVINRFVREAGKENPKFLRPKSVPVVIGNDDLTVYSYGMHFPLAQRMPGVDGNPWWLLNGDRWSGGWGGTTAGHQRDVRSAVMRTGLPFMIVPASAIRKAGIIRSTIVPVEILPDRYTWEPATRPGNEDPTAWELTDGSGYRNWEHRLPEDLWHFERQVHHLGESLFRADYSYYHREPSHVDLTTFVRVWPAGEYVTGTAYFLSAFDTQDSLYFLAQLPEGAHPETVAEAFEALKPTDVQYAERQQGLKVLRQGDVFAIPTEYKTRELQGPSQRSAYVLGVNHQVTEVRTVTDAAGDVSTYGRGYMRHRPQEFGRRPEHRVVKLGDTKTWFELRKNTVPEGRSWSIGGGVD